MRFEVLGLTYQEIDARGRPSLPDQPEAFQAVLYDTLNCLAAGPAGGELIFMQGNPANDGTLTNVQGGQLPSGFRFRIQAFGCDVLREPSAGNGSTAGVLTDIARLLKTNRATFTFRLNDKPYYPIPLTFAHASGGETGFIAASLTAPANLQYANNGVFSGGFQTDGSLWILDKQPFSISLRFNPVFTALSADALLRMWMRGTLYRPIQ